jgi:hypothetical protein
MAKPKEGFHDLFCQIPEALWQALQAEADSEGRSLTKQLTWILKQRYPGALDAGSAQTPKGKKAGGK